MTPPGDADKSPPAPNPEPDQKASSTAWPSYVEGFSVAPTGQTTEKTSAPAPAPATQPVVPQPTPAGASEPAPLAAASSVATPAPASETPKPAAPEVEMPCGRAWQPFTFKGVAAFAYASADRIFLVQVLMAVIAGISLLWLVDCNYTPVLVDAMRRMPDEAVIRNGNLEGVETGLLAERKFLSVAIDLRQGNSVGQSADLQLELHQRHVALCPSYRSLAGNILFQYPLYGELPVGRNNLQPWWDAWKPVCYAGIVLGVASGLLLIWLFMATFYGIISRLVAYFADRAIHLGQCWNLAAAALMPGALLMIAAIVLYGLQLVDLIELSILIALHLVIPWIYLIAAPLRAPRLSQAPETKANPFG